MTEAPNHKAEIYYYDIGDYLSREQKLDIIASFKSMENLPFTRLKPNEHGDWISQRNDKFGTWIPIEADKKFNSQTHSYFTIHSLGVNTNRDIWVYGFSKKQTIQNMRNTISFYNKQVKDLQEARKKNPKLSADDFKDNDSRKISWCSSLVPKLNTLTECNFQEDSIVLGNYRPFVKEHLYFGKLFIHRRGQFDNLFPTQNTKNLVICIQSIAGKQEFSPLITNCIADLHFNGDTQCFPLYWYETIEPEQNSLFGDDAQIVR
ncbi:type ISP restriction/modification enzyme, partial [Treponema sp. UBA7570]